MTKGRTKVILIALLSILLFSQPACLDYLTDPTEDIGTNSSGSNDNDTTSTTAYARVDLYSGGYEDFEYNSFFFYDTGWSGARFLKIYDRNGTSYSISKDDVTKVIFYGKTWSNYFEKNCWELKIYYSGTSQKGHVNSYSDRIVGGNDLYSGAYKKVKWSNIDQIIFYR